MSFKTHLHLHFLQLIKQLSSSGVSLTHQQNLLFLYTIKESKKCHREKNTDSCSKLDIFGNGE